MVALLELGPAQRVVCEPPPQRGRWCEVANPRQLLIARITPAELKAKLDAGDPVMVVDLRHSLDFAADPAVIPGAIHLTPDEVEGRAAEIPRDREVVLYCT